MPFARPIVLKALKQVVMLAAFALFANTAQANTASNRVP